MSNFSLTATRGDTNGYNCAVTNGGAVFSLSGCTLWFTLKYNANDPDPGIAQVNSTAASASGEIIITDAPNGIAQIILAPVALAALTQQQLLVADLQLKDSLGRVCTVASGIVELGLDVTQSTS